jgi:alkylation response protein AidB-like acyl-CoA dehydrogenase
MNERAAIAGGGPGGPTWEDLVRLAARLELDGAPAIEKSAVRQRLADFYTRAKGLQYTSYRTLTALSRGQTPGPQSSLGKLVSATMRQQMAAFAMELQAQCGAVHDPAFAEDAAAWQGAYLAAPGSRLAGGTDEVLRNIIAERVLGLPPEARADKGMAFHEIPTGPSGRA